MKKDDGTGCCCLLLLVLVICSVGSAWKWLNPEERELPQTASTIEVEERHYTLRYTGNESITQCRLEVTVETYSPEQQHELAELKAEERELTRNNRTLVTGSPP